MTYQTNKFTPHLKPTHKRSLWGGNLLKTLFVVLLIVAAALALNGSDIARGSVSSALSPFFKAGDFVYGSLGGLPNFFSDRSQLIDQNRILAEELESLKIQVADYEALKYENLQLREGMKKKPEGESVAAAVLARSPQIPLDTLFIDVGAGDGADAGGFVLAGERALIGKVAKSSKNGSTVSLNSFVGAVTYGFVARTEEPLEIRGDGGGLIKARVPIDFDIIPGDEIMVNGLFPYLAAVVGMIEEDKPSGFKEVFMSLPVNVSKINLVFVEPAAN